jgi:putative transposase
MARIARVVVPDYPHHVTQRGNRRQEVFFSDTDYEIYLSFLAKTLRKVATEVWAYCLMPNHVHLVMVPKNEDGLRAVLGEAHRHYTRHINFREGWRGHLWQERFHSFPMDEEYLLSAVRYVELNPVRAGLCSKADEWKWSSAVAHMEAKDDGVVTVNPMLSRVSNWRDYLSIADGERLDLLRKHQRSGRPLGNNKFIDKVEQLVGRSVRRRKPGPKKSVVN